MGTLADQLVRDIGELQARVQTVQLEPAQIANGAVELLGEVSKSKITGEEERYSHTDLVDFEANVAGRARRVQRAAPARAPRATRTWPTRSTSASTTWSPRSSRTAAATASSPTRADERRHARSSRRRSTRSPSRCRRSGQIVVARRLTQRPRRRRTLSDGPPRPPQLRRGGAGARSRSAASASSGSPSDGEAPPTGGAVPFYGERQAGIATARAGPAAVRRPRRRHATRAGRSARPAAHVDGGGRAMTGPAGPPADERRPGRPAARHRRGRRACRRAG